jgi:hypothetical protein
LKGLESKLNVRVNDLESKLAMIENGDEEEKESSEEEVDSEIQVEELSNNDKSFNTPPELLNEKA